MPWTYSELYLAAWDLLCILFAVNVGLVVFYLSYIAAINIYYDWQGLATWVQVGLALPMLAFVLLDFTANMTLATIIFWDLPAEFLVTQRFMRYRSPTTGPGYRKTVATVICTQALNPFDPTRKHC